MASAPDRLTNPHPPSALTTAKPARTPRLRRQRRAPQAAQACLEVGLEGNGAAVIPPDALLSRQQLALALRPAQAVVH